MINSKVAWSYYRHIEQIAEVRCCQLRQENRSDSGVKAATERLCKAILMQYRLTNLDHIPFTRALRPIEERVEYIHNLSSVPAMIHARISVFEPERVIAQATEHYEKDSVRPEGFYPQSSLQEELEIDYYELETIVDPYRIRQMYQAIESVVQVQINRIYSLSGKEGAKAIDKASKIEEALKRLFESTTHLILDRINRPRSEFQVNSFSHKKLLEYRDKKENYVYMSVAQALNISRKGKVKKTKALKAVETAFNIKIDV